MNAINMPGFTAETSLYKTSGHYQAGRHAINSPVHMIIPAIPRCENCDYILNRCFINGWRPRAACNACLNSNCWDEPPVRGPFSDDPFGPLPRI